MLASRGTTKCKPQRWAEARVERAVRRAGRAVLRPTKQPARRRNSTVADLQLQVPQVLIDRGQRSVDADPVAAVTSAPARGVSLTLAAAPAAVAGIVVQALQRAARGAAPLAETSRLRRTMPNLALRECRGQWVLVLGARLRLPCRLACNLRPPR